MIPKIKILFCTKSGIWIAKNNVSGGIPEKWHYYSFTQVSLFFAKNEDPNSKEPLNNYFFFLNK